MARRSRRCADSSSRFAEGSNSSLVRLLRSTAASFKAVNNRDKNYTVAKVTGRMEQVDASIARYLRALDQGGKTYTAVPVPLSQTPGKPTHPNEGDASEWRNTHSTEGEITGNADANFAM